MLVSLHLTLDNLHRKTEMNIFIPHYTHGLSSALTVDKFPDLTEGQ